MKFGILGYGKIVREQIAPAIHEAGHQIAAVGSRSGTRPDGFAGTVHDSYQACIEDPNVEAIYIATPNHLHTPLSIQAMQAGKHVLCEKPAAMSVAELEQIQRCQAASGVTFQEALMVRHHPQWLQVADLELGSNRLLQTSFTYTPRLASDVRSDPALGGGVWFDIGCYGLWACWAFGARELNQVNGQWLTNGQVPDQICLTLEFDALTAQIIVAARHFRQQHLSLISDRCRLTMARPFNPEGSCSNSFEMDLGHQKLTSDANQYATMIEDFCGQTQQAQFVMLDSTQAITQWSEQAIRRFPKMSLEHNERQKHG